MLQTEFLFQWIRTLSALEEKDMKRLLLCLETFFRNVVKTLIDHNVFESTALQENLTNTSNFFINTSLQQ